MRSIAKIIGLTVVLNLFFLHSFSQGCSTLGQSPGNAFPVCGTNVFTQTSVPVCGNRKIPNKCNDGNTYTDKNPYWYKFTCYASGTLGFVITPKNTNDDYDWQLFDITGKNPEDIYNDASLIVSANWSGSSGPTGASPAGRNPFECASLPAQGVSTFSTMPNIVAGHDYILLISHYDGATQSGYTLSYPSGSQGGTASIVNPVSPAVVNAYAVCDGTEIVLKLNKRVNCTSIAADGSDFSVTGPVPISIVSVTGNGCNNGFDSDSLILKLNRVLSPGTYTVNAQMGSDGNTLTDNCSNVLATGAVGTLLFTPSQPTPMDSIKPVICIKDTLELVFSKPMNCSSIAADGSDFQVTGPASVTIKSASGVCTNGISTIVRIILTKPIRVNGRFQILLKNGSDGNTLIDECSQVTPAGSVLPFTTSNITTADFQAITITGCKYDSVYLQHNGTGITTQWQWQMDSTLIGTGNSAVYFSNAFGNHTARLLVSNGKCTDTSSIPIIFDNQTVKAAFTVSSDTSCPMDLIGFTDQSSSTANAWRWDFGNGQTSDLQKPPLQQFPGGNRAYTYTVKLVSANAFGCSDSTYHAIYVLLSCYIDVPTAFTPNGDGKNDYLYPLNSFKASNLVFRIYNRGGQVIFESRNSSKKWDGRVNGELQPSGAYVWTLDYMDITKQQKVSMKGTTVLIR